MSIIAELNDDLERVRNERINAQRVTKIENERLQEILFMCQLFNESNNNQMFRRFNDSNCDHFTQNTDNNNDNNNNNNKLKPNNNELKFEDIDQSVSEDIFTKSKSLFIFLIVCFNHFSYLFTDFICIAIIFLFVFCFSINNNLLNEIYFIFIEFLLMYKMVIILRKIFQI